MDNDQHYAQDSSELYAVYKMQEAAEGIGRSAGTHSPERWSEFVTYLSDCGLTVNEFENGRFRSYKDNVDRQVPAWVERLSLHFEDSTFFFENVEKEMRDRGMKADVLLHVRGLARESIAVSIKNYIGGGGITRPQVSSGTFLSFATGFVFDRVGVGQYVDPRPNADSPVFRGSTPSIRNAVLDYMDEHPEDFVGIEGSWRLVKPMLAQLDRLQAEMRAELLGPDCEMYDQARVRAVVERIAKPGMDAVLVIFAVLGVDVVRHKFLDRIGMDADGKEEALFFEADRYVDSITNPAYHLLREQLNDPGTAFIFDRHKQNIRFEFKESGGQSLLKVDVPFTINTNGAWFRPRERFSGEQTYIDKGHPVSLRWGQRRPYKSKEIATSTNTYLDLRKTGIFG